MFYKLESVLQSQGQILRSWNVFHFYKNAILRHIVQILFGVFFPSIILAIFLFHNFPIVQ